MYQLETRFARINTRYLVLKNVSSCENDRLSACNLFLCIPVLVHRTCQVWYEYEETYHLRTRIKFKYRQSSPADDIFAPFYSVVAQRSSRMATAAAWQSSSSSSSKRVFIFWFCWVSLNICIKHVFCCTRTYCWLTAVLPGTGTRVYRVIVLKKLKNVNCESVLMMVETHHEIHSYQYACMHYVVVF